MKILLVLNKPNREMPIMEAIKREVLALDPRAQVEITEMVAAGFNKFVFAFRPDVIMTFPFTVEGFSRWYYLFKVLLGSRIVSLRAEGVIDFEYDYSVQWAVGFDDYGDTLVDCELFWGEKMARVVGGELLRQGKLSSMERTRVVGYPRLESYFRNGDAPAAVLPERLACRLAAYPRSRTLLFITGFHLANYTRQNLFDAGDLNAEEMIDELLEAVERSKRFRAAWIESVTRAATENPDALIVLKKHPIEKREDYEHLSALPNVLFVYEDIQVEELIPHASVFFHYGSTALADAYLTGIPAIYVYSPDNQQWYTDLGWPSSRRVHVGDVPATVRDVLEHGLAFERTPEVDRVLHEIFNIAPGRAYAPAREIAKVLLEPAPPQRISPFDRHLIRAVSAVVASPFYHRGLLVLARLRRLAARG